MVWSYSNKIIFNYLLMQLSLSLGLSFFCDIAALDLFQESSLTFKLFSISHFLGYMRFLCLEDCASACSETPAWDVGSAALSMDCSDRISVPQNGSEDWSMDCWRKLISCLSKECKEEDNKPECCRESKGIDIVVLALVKVRSGSSSMPIP